ncbi:MAG TPA: beta-eliminating lyase-related protein, partial [Gemmatimonadales bacterium]|nr:beta-eliminating lyase-related protein [Gemmatimonadales bacterium]
MRSFASDNHAGVHPEVLAAIAAANQGDAPAYGDDRFTAEAVACLRQAFGQSVEPFLVFGGTAANVLGLQAVVRRYQAVICAETAHINVDECGAPERIIGCKLLTVPTPNGKLSPHDLDRHLHGFGDQHHAQPRVVSISQVTEYGTVYRPDELRALSAYAHQHGLLLHMDGARLANAAAALNCGLRDITVDVGVDLLSFGGTKNGLLAAEAVVFLDPALAADFRFIRKQGMQLASKMRFLGAQIAALFSDELWRRNAAHANQMAARLANLVRTIPQITITQPVEANAVFARMPRAAIGPLQNRFP